MPGSIKSVLVQALCLGLVWLVWRLRLRDARETPPNGLTLLFAFSSLVLLAAALFAGRDLHVWSDRARLPQVDSLQALAALGNLKPALVAGRAAEETGVEYDTDGTLWAPPTIRLALGNQEARLEPIESVERIGWHTHYSPHARSREWLDEGEQVVAVVTVRHGARLAGGFKGEPAVWAEPQVIFRGGGESFLAEAAARARRPVPQIVAWAAVLGAVVTALLPLVSLLRSSSRPALGGAASASSDPATSFWDRLLVRPPSRPAAYAFAVGTTVPVLMLAALVGLWLLAA